MRNDQLRAARAKTGKTQVQVAKEAGITEIAYQNYESGRREPKVGIAIRIADALHIMDLRELFAQSDAPEQSIQLQDS